MKLIKFILIICVIIGSSLCTETRTNTSTKTKSKFMKAQAILDKYQAFQKKAEAFKSSGNILFKIRL